MQAWVPRLLPWCGVEAVVVRYDSDQRKPSARTDTLTVQTVLRGEGLSALPCSTAVFPGPRSPQPGASRAYGAGARSMIYSGKLWACDMGVAFIFS